VQNRTAPITIPMSGIPGQLPNYDIYMNGAVKIKLTFSGGTSGQLIPIIYNITQTTTISNTACNYFLNGI
jgi:hypothetical protein